MDEKKIPYQVNGRQFEEMIVADDGAKAKRPVIFMQPDWKGVCFDTIAQARTVAGSDYVVLMADMFGSGYWRQAQDPRGIGRQHGRRPPRPRLYGRMRRQGL